MKGESLLTLNKVTMMEAVQFWLNEEILKERVKVTSVKQLSQGTNKDQFEVRLSPSDLEGNP